MTGKAFLKRLQFQLDFLMPEDRETVLSYYENKLAEVSDSSEEEALVRTFGSPEHIADQLKAAFINQNASSSTVLTEENDVDAETEETGDRPENETDLKELNTPAFAEAGNTPFIKEDATPAADDIERDLIFSKPAVEETTPEIIHSLENREIPALYGEKVVIEDRKAPIEEISLEPLDEANGFTKEEIQMAKAETLEKAKKFDSDQLDRENVKTDPPAPLQEEELDDSSSESESGSTVNENAGGIAIELDEDEIPRTKEYSGLFKMLFSRFALSQGTTVFLTVLLSILISPLLLVAFGAVGLVYLSLMAFTAALALISFALIVVLVIAGVIELVYGFAMLFDTISVALIELGLGTVLFALVVAISALIYEFLFGVVPKVIKWLTGKFTHYIKVLYCYLYGGKA